MLGELQCTFSVVARVLAQKLHVLHVFGPPKSGLLRRKIRFLFLNIFDVIIGGFRGFNDSQMAN